jgi:hypothetical protein
VGKTNDILAEYGPVGVATIELQEPGAEIKGQGPPGQFSKAAFFQRTLISSRLYKTLRLIPVFSSISGLLIT